MDIKQANVAYPCWWTYALIGADEEGLRLAIGAVTKGHQHKVAFSKESEHKKYVSLHVDIWVVSEDERNTLFQTFKDDPRVKMIL
jgi:putative lipoic acid-binding regulatory protein